MNRHGDIRIGKCFFWGVLAAFLLGFPWIDYSAFGAPFSGLPFIVDAGTGDQIRVAAAYDPTRQQFLIAIEDDPSSSVKLKLFSKGGRLIWQGLSLAGARPDVAYSPAADQYLLVQQAQSTSNGWDIIAIRINPNGTFGGSLFYVSFHTGDEKYPRATYNQHSSYNNFLVVWEDILGGEKQVWAQRVAATQGGGPLGSNLLGGPIQITTDAAWNVDPDVAYNLNRNEYLVVYTKDATKGSDPSALNVYGRRVTADGILLAENSIDSSGNAQLHAAVAAYRLDYVTPYLVVFEDYWNDTGGDIRGYLVHKDGYPVSLVNVSTNGGGVIETNPAICANGEEGIYTVAWQKYTSGDRIYVRKILHSGSLKPVCAVSTAPPSGLFAEEYPAVAAGEGTALVAWQEGFLSGDTNIAGRILGPPHLAPVYLMLLP